LTSHASHGGNEELNTFEDDKQSQDFVMQAWEKIKPKQKKRLNIIAITDPKEIRKWSKITYGDRVEENEKEKKGFLMSLLSGKSPKAKKKSSTKHESNGDESQLLNDVVKNLSVDESDNETSAVPDINGDRSVLKSHDSVEQPTQRERVEGEPEWFYPGYRPRARTISSDAPITFNDGQSVFNIDKPREKYSTLPKSDSAKLVLARTHFILEHEDLLPPYHVRTLNLFGGVAQKLLFQTFTALTYTLYIDILLEL